MTAPTAPPVDLDPWVEDTEPTAEPERPSIFRRNTGAATLDQTRAFIARFAAMPSQAALDVATLWAAHTHCVDVNEHLGFDTTPRIAFISDKPASGKTTALEAVLRVSFHGNQVVDPTPGTFCQLVSEERSSVGIDETDCLFGAGAAKSTLRSLLNSGYRRGAKWSRANKPPVSVFAPVALAGLGKKFRTAAELAPLRGRSLVIEMVPTAPTETYRERLHGPMAGHIRESLTVWCKRNYHDITGAWPEPVEGITARHAEIAEPLLMLADTAQGHWPETARVALREILLGETVEPAELPLGDALMRDLLAVFGEESKLSTIAIVDALYALPASPWRALWPSRSTAPRELAGMLAPFGIQPCPVRLEDKVLRGYHRDALQPLWDELDAAAAEM